MILSWVYGMVVFNLTWMALEHLPPGPNLIVGVVLAVGAFPLLHYITKRNII